MVASAVRVVARALAATSIAGSVLTVATLDAVEALMRFTGSTLLEDLGTIKTSYLARIEASGISAQAEAREKVAKAATAENQTAQTRVARPSRKGIVEHRAKQLKGRIAAGDILSDLEFSQALRAQAAQDVSAEYRALERAVSAIQAKGGRVVVGVVTRTRDPSQPAAFDILFSSLKGAGDKK